MFSRDFFRSPAVLVLAVSVLLFLVVFIRSIEVRGTGDVEPTFVPGLSPGPTSPERNGAPLREVNPGDPAARPRAEPIPDRELEPPQD